MTTRSRSLVFALVTATSAWIGAVQAAHATSAVTCSPAKDSPARACTELTAEEFSQVVDDGETVVHSGPAKPWPDTTLYAYLDATPGEAAALFVDYPAGKAFTASMTKAEVFDCPEPKARRRCVFYELAIPIVGAESYTLTDDLYPYSDRTGYSIYWNHINPGRSKAIHGSVRFERLGGTRGGTLMAYYNNVTPGSFTGKLPGLAGQALKQAKDFVTAFREGLMDEMAARDQRQHWNHLEALEAMASEGTKK